MPPADTLPAPAGALAAAPPAAAAAAGQRALERFEAGAAHACLALPADTGWRTSATAVFAASDFVARFAQQCPEDCVRLLTSGRLQADCTASEFERRLRAALGAPASDDAPDDADAAPVEEPSAATLARVLRRFRRCESVRIAWRDLAGWADLATTLADQSALADACVRVAVDVLTRQARARDGVPRDGAGNAQTLTVLAVGKLGGAELNFSSDIDLILLYGEPGTTDGARALDNAAHFARLGQALVAALAEPTVDGFAFRMDLRLRPFGSSGALVVHLGQLEQYLLTQAREWERLALVKARPIVGDAATIEGVEGLLRPFVYRRYLDFGAFEALRDLKVRLEREVARRGLENNVKKGRGGIREIEFIAQAFQLIRGGREPRLRARATLDTLAALGELGELGGESLRVLDSAYRFLRALENRLQIVDDRSTHALPDDEAGRARLAWTLGLADTEALTTTLCAHRERVHAVFAQVFNLPAGERPAAADVDDGQAELVAVWEDEVERGQGEHALAAAGFADPAEVWRRLADLRHSSRYRGLSTTARARLDRLLPMLLGDLAAVAGDDDTLARLLRLVEVIAPRSVYLALLAEHHGARRRLVDLCAASAWIADFVTRHPLLLDELIDPASLFEPPDRAGVTAEIEHALADLAADDLEGRMDALRQVRQTNVLRVAAVDITGRLPLMRVSDHLTWIAEATLEAVVAVVYPQMVARHGRPRTATADGESEPAFGIVAYGKLGGFELGYGSDLDLVFLYDAPGEDRGTDGARPLDNAAFFVRLAQRIVHVLTTVTPAGTLYAIDTRLRPNGAAGTLVSSLQAFVRYQHEHAWTWEHQALVRARMVTAEAGFSERFEAVRAEVLQRPRESAVLRAEVAAMRERMRRELARGGDGRIDLKQGRGGVADIEFMVQYDVLAGAQATPALVAYTDNIRLLEALAEHGQLGADTAHALAEAYRLFRRRIHRLDLLDRSAVIEPDAELAAAIDQVTAIWQRRMH